MYHENTSIVILGFNVTIFNIVISFYIIYIIPFNKAQHRLNILRTIADKAI